MIFILWKKHVRHTHGNGSPSNTLVIIPTRWLINITLIDNTAPLLFLLLYGSICNPPLYFSFGDSKICLPSLYNLTVFSSTDRIDPNLFLPIKSTNIYISFGKFILNRSISMEVRSSEFPLSYQWKVFCYCI